MVAAVASPERSSTPPSSSRLFPSHREKDPESGLGHHRYRTLDYRTGRFLQKEPVLSSRPRTHYLYATASPTTGRDPRGLQTEEEIRDHVKRTDLRLWEELTILGKPEQGSWEFLRKPIGWFDNWEIDWNTKIIYIDDDEEGLETGAHWVREGVRELYRKAEDSRRKRIQQIGNDEAGKARSQTQTALEALINTMEFAAWFNQDYWASDISLVFAGGRAGALGFHNDRTYLVPERAFVPDGGSVQEGWGSTGFREEFRDSSHQVAHASAVLSAVSGNPNFGPAAIQIREARSGRGPADFRLNKTMSGIITQFSRHEPVRPRSEIIKLMREQLLDRSQRGPWTGPPDGNPD